METAYYFKRNVWDRLINWKKTSKITLEVNGARQVGKTFILKKFCSENFKNFIYINMTDDSGKVFLECIDRWHNQFFTKYSNNTAILQLMKMYNPAFENSFNTVVLIDEIQESSRVYNLIRNFTRELEAKFIVTGSYLGKVLDKEFFLPAGDLDKITIYPLSFPEFLDIFDMKERQKKCYSNLTSDKELETLFGLYMRLGGYPAVIAKYLEEKDINKCDNILEKIIDTFISESLRYFNTINDFDVFEDLMKAVAVSTLREKRGGNLTESLSNIMKNVTNRPSKDAISKAIAWLKTSGIIGYASKLIDANVMDEISCSRFYFNDVGIAYYFADLADFDYGAIKGFLAENYVFTVLRNKFFIYGRKSSVVCGTRPMFSTYSKTGGELDFIVCGKHGGRKIGIEVKAKKGSANTGRKMLEDGIIDYLYLLKGKTGGGEADGIITLPLYLADQIEFEFGNNIKYFSFN